MQRYISLRIALNVEAGRKPLDDVLTLLASSYAKLDPETNTLTIKLPQDLTIKSANVNGAQALS